MLAGSNSHDLGLDFFFPISELPVSGAGCSLPFPLLRPSSFVLFNNMVYPKYWLFTPCSFSYIQNVQSFCFLCLVSAPIKRERTIRLDMTQRGSLRSEPPIAIPFSTSAVSVLLEGTETNIFGYCFLHQW